MSAERQVFRQMTDLIALKKQFDLYFGMQSKILVGQALREFLVEHPEVQTVRWSQYDTRGAVWTGFGGPDNLHTSMAIEVKGEWLGPGAYQLDEQLAKCLRALELNFDSLKEAAIALWGEGEMVARRDFITGGRVECGL